MKCRICSEQLEPTITDLPFKIGKESIVIIKGLPVLQCRNCNEYVIQDEVMEKVDILLSRVDEKVEVEILSFAA
jgi:YgiT-type zinc finger domain-containing protein